MTPRDQSPQPIRNRAGIVAATLIADASWLVGAVKRDEVGHGALSTAAYMREAAALIEAFVFDNVRPATAAEAAEKLRRLAYEHALTTIAGMRQCRNVPAGPTRDLHTFVCPYCVARDVLLDYVVPFAPAEAPHPWRTHAVSPRGVNEPLQTSAQLPTPNSHLETSVATLVGELRHLAAYLRGRGDDAPDGVAAQLTIWADGMETLLEQHAEARA